MGFQTHSVNTRVRSHSGGHLFKSVEDVFISEVYGFSLAVYGCHTKSFGIVVDSDDAFRAQQVGALNRKLSDRPTTPDRNRVAGLNVAILGSHVACRKDVRQEEYLLVVQSLRNLYRADIRERYAHILG